MKLSDDPKLKMSLLAGVVCVAVAVLLIVRNASIPVTAQNTSSNETPPAAASTNQPSTAEAPRLDSSTNAPAPAVQAGPVTNRVASPAAAELRASELAEAVQAPPNPPPAASSSAPAAASSDEISLSFQGANVDMVVQWLAKTSGKSVVKHPRVQCQLTIVSSKKLTTREALTLVYRALSLEGFTAIETSKSILIVPEGQEPKMSPELVESSSTEIPEGRQRLVKVFQLAHVQPGDMREKIKAVLSEKSTVESNDRAQQLIVTDYTENIRLLGELIKELDVSSVSDTIIEIFSLKHSEAEELGNLLNLVLNAQPGAPSTPSRSSSSRSGPSPPSEPPPSSSGPAAPSSSPPVRLWPDKTANRLIVAAPKSRIPEIKELIETLDTQKPADVGVRVIALNHVNAQDLVREIGPLYQKMSGRSLKEIIEVTANNRSNSLIVLSSEENFKEIKKLVETLDTEEAQERVVKPFPLKNADAEDVATQLQELYREQSSSTRYVYYFYPNEDRSRKFSVVADRRRNTVIVQAPPSTIESIGQMIRALDEPVTDNTLAPKIYALKFVSAVDVEDVLNELFVKKQEQRDYWDYYWFGGGSQQDDRDIGRLYGKVRITSEPYSNSIIVTANSMESLEAVEEILKQIDVPSQAGETTVRHVLKFAEAVQIATSVNILFARGGSPPLRQTPQPGQQNDNRNPGQQAGSPQSGFELERETKEDAYYPWLGGQQENLRGTDGRNTVRPVSDMIGRVRVVPDRRSNSLLVTANVHLLPQVLKLINDLDAPTAQVMIEAKIVEVSSDFRDKLGVRWSPDGSKSFNTEDLDGSILAGGNSSYQNVFLGSKLADSLRTGVLDATVNLDVLVQFLRKNSDSKVLAEPHISVRDNELGKLFFGAQVPFLSGSVLNPGFGGRNDTFTYRDVGVILEVTPHINNENEVALRIRAESSTIRPGETLFGAAILDTRSFRTDLVVKSGETVVLGGIIQQELVDTVRKVPGLGDVPGIGWAFKKKDKINREIELMVFLRPRVTRSPADAQALLQEMENKAPRVKEPVQTN